MTSSKKHAAVLLGVALVAAGGGYLAGVGQASSDADDLADAFLQLGRSRDAIDVFQERHDRSPNDPLARVGLVLAHFRDGERALRRNEHEAAADAFRSALRLRGDVYYLHLELGHALANQNRWEEGLAACQEAARLNPKSIGAHLRSFYLLLQLGRAAEGGKVLERVIELARDKPDLRAALPGLLQTLAKACEGEGDLEAAAAHRKRAEDFESR